MVRYHLVSTPKLLFTSLHRSYLWIIAASQPHSICGTPTSRHVFICLASHFFLFAFISSLADLWLSCFLGLSVLPSAFYFYSHLHLHLHLFSFTTRAHDHDSHLQTYVYIHAFSKYIQFYDSTSSLSLKQHSGSAFIITLQLSLLFWLFFWPSALSLLLLFCFSFPYSISLCQFRLHHFSYSMILSTTKASSNSVALLPTLLPIFTAIHHHESPTSRPIQGTGRRPGCR